MEQVVGHQADSSCGGVVVLGEGAHLRLARANRGLRRVLTEATCHVNPIEEGDGDKSLPSLPARQEITFM